MAKKRGIGMASMWYGIGVTGMPNPASAFVELLDDGSAIVLTGCADIGQGSSTILAQIAAETLGISYEDVVVVSADTGVTPEAGATSASRQTYISGNAVLAASLEAKQNVLMAAAEMLGNVPISDLFIDKGKIILKGEETHLTLKEVVGYCRSRGILTLGHGWFNPATTVMDPITGEGIPYATYAFATHIVEVEVDTETGKVEVKRIVAAHDVGKAINPAAVEGQIEGGCVMGIGYALMEEVKLKEGGILNPYFAEYFIPTAIDIPQIYTIIVEDPEITGPFGAKGIGEPALIPTAPAIANALADALGISFYELPITLERIVEAYRLRL
ncbi:Aldehyde oxidase/xanthine dehydrogenase,molybdopterin binding [Moorella glycerini]|uniref:Nicotinate dehydrogenase medium molybdopterin subunit n=1 Tax=Neomoorella stamsii TaxID=1266720 RepID=A0A9X7P6D6_9FIRM|nr:MULTISPECIES: molybdopterin cofactor-binding domain-containing protein [Moorella]PRR73416.1 Nicotinate dehydrogenase medium molybdopterin subunit [Moorella stamsii]CEP69185.1 Aldehyde oxidase/xanthine dehydrogenase,molybdopterin binding [Moorella glycerini]